MPKLKGQKKLRRKYTKRAAKWFTNRGITTSNDANYESDLINNQQAEALRLAYSKIDLLEKQVKLYERVLATYAICHIAEDLENAPYERQAPFSVPSRL